MKNKLMMGWWRYIIHVPPSLWEKQAAVSKKRFAARVGFMSPEHRLVHHFVVKELPSAGKPLSSEFIANAHAR